MLLAEVESPEFSASPSSEIKSSTLVAELDELLLDVEELAVLLVDVEDVLDVVELDEVEALLELDWASCAAVISEYRLLAVSRSPELTASEISEM
jgi:hypothetical protein